MNGFPFLLACFRVTLSAALSQPLDVAESVRLSSGQPVLFVTHATWGSQWPVDGPPRAVAFDYETVAFAEKGIDAAVRVSKYRGWYVIYLTAAKGRVVMEDRRPTAILLSDAGVHRVRLPTRHVFIAGGELSGCAWTGTARSSIVAAFREQRLLYPGQRPVLALHFILDAMFGSEVWDRRGAPKLRTSVERIRFFRDRLSYRALLWRSGEQPQIELYDGAVHAATIQEGAPGAPLLEIRLMLSSELKNLHIPSVQPVLVL